jgi:aminopeptidase C
MVFRTVNIIAPLVNIRRSGKMKFLKEDMKGYERVWNIIHDREKREKTPGAYQYIGSTDGEHQFRTPDCLLLDAYSYHDVLVCEGDFDYLTRYEYTTRLMKLSIGTTGGDADADIEKQGYKRVWAEHTDYGSFIVYRRLRQEGV